MNAPSAFALSVIDVLIMVLGFYKWIIIIGAILSWLVAFGVINKYNRVVQGISDAIFRITEPVLKPIRRILPPMGGFDLSPLVLIFIIIFLQLFLARLEY